MADQLQAERLRVFVEDHTGKQRREARIVANASVRELVPVLTTAMGLPMSDPAGRPVIYHLAYGDRPLLDDETLAAAAVTDGGTLVLVPGMTAGGGLEFALEEGIGLFGAVQEIKNLLPEGMELFDTIEEIKGLLSKGPSSPSWLESLQLLSSTSTTVELRLEGDLEAFIPEQLIERIAEATQTQKDEISVVSLTRGSVIVKLEVPEQAVRRLEELIRSNEELLQALTISGLENPAIRADPSYRLDTPSVWSQTTPLPLDTRGGDSLTSQSGIGQTADSSIAKIAQDSVFKLFCDDDNQARITVEGVTNYRSAARQPLNLDYEAMNHAMQSIGNAICLYQQHQAASTVARNSWYESAKFEGSRLYAELSRSVFSEWFAMACQASVQNSGAEEYLTLVFEGPRWHLGMPYELLFDEIGPLVGRFPFCRQVAGVPFPKGEKWIDFMRGSSRRKEKVRVLLIAGDLEEDGPSESEVQQIKSLLEDTAAMHNLDLAVDMLLLRESGCDEVTEALTRCSYHIVHYAGECFFDAATGEGSGLQLDDLKLTARDLAYLLRNSETRLFYMSASVSAAMGDKHLLHNNDFLGVMDAVVMAGVPNVFGYRWPVTKEGAHRFAALFYLALFETHSPAKAAFRARSEICRLDRFDETWLSPILVSQSQQI